MQLGSLRALIKGLAIYTYFSKRYSTPSGYERNLRIINMWRNRLSHGGLITHEFIDEYKTKIKLSKLFTILKKNKGFIKETENILSEYNSNLIGFDVSETVHYLKIQGHMNFINRKMILNIEGFKKYFIGVNYKHDGNYNEEIKTKYASFFGKTLATKYFGENISVNKVPRDEIFRNEYLLYLIYKSTNKIQMSKQEKVVFLVLTITKNRQNILYESFEAILEISFIDKSRLTSIIRKLGLSKVKKPPKTDAKDVATNVLLSSGFKLYKNKYLINKKQEILKLTSYHPFSRKMKVFDRVNNYGRKSKAVTINSKQIALHRILAELFIPNPKGYKYVSVKTMNYEVFKISDIIWSQKNTETREKKRKKTKKK